MATLHLEVYLFRNFEMRRTSTGESLSAGQRAAELVAYLLLSTNRPVRREHLQALFWPEVGERRARRNLRQTLWQLGGALRAGCEADPVELITRAGDWLQIAPEAPVWCDVHRFTAALGPLAEPLARIPRPDEVHAAEQAVTLYRGDLLEAWDASWCWIERESLRTRYLRLLDWLMDVCLHAGRHDRGIDYGLRALATEPASERAYRRLMRLHIARGDRCGALRVYARCREALADELAVTPDARTRSLAHHIRTGTGRRERLPALGVTVGPAPHAPLRSFSAK